MDLVKQLREAGVFQPPAEDDPRVAPRKFVEDLAKILAGKIEAGGAGAKRAADEGNPTDVINYLTFKINPEASKKGVALFKANPNVKKATFSVDEFDNILPDSIEGKEFGYRIGYWGTLGVFVEKGKIELDFSELEMEAD